MTAGIGEQPVVTDAVKAGGQHMLQEAAHELIRIERHRLVARPAFGPIVLPAKGNTDLTRFIGPF